MQQFLILQLEDCARIDKFLSLEEKQRFVYTSILTMVRVKVCKVNSNAHATPQSELTNNLMDKQTRNVTSMIEYGVVKRELVSW